MLDTHDTTLNNTHREEDDEDDAWAKLGLGCVWLCWLDFGLDLCFFSLFLLLLIAQQHSTYMHFHISCDLRMKVYVSRST